MTFSCAKSHRCLRTQDTFVLLFILVTTSLGHALAFATPTKVSLTSPRSSAAFNSHLSSLTIEPKKQKDTTKSSLHAIPRSAAPYKRRPPTFNKETSQWEPSSETESPPYGPIGSFLRGGPTPFLIRLVSPDQYDQAVFKYMAQSSCSRAEAQGNMDAYFNNAADWMYQKSEEARGAPKVDYTVLKPKQAILVITWALFVTPFLGRCVYLIGFTDAGW
eukprot:CAMPEP_0171359788 /NCGR_PEP_ID=MMETSP0879-20121228/812_1 /TAXON_ID=67004 /ORGANISM="Thalassiosira weissflogii, Strain CCMP1336" /LENGTH=217 /DNA_ID=CAMNT_0011865987 /DNA_START=29 /DNA_END=679 /DNA_ORIENTATION=+